MALKGIPIDRLRQAGFLTADPRKDHGLKAEFKTGELQRSMDYHIATAMHDFSVCPARGFLRLIA